MPDTHVAKTRNFPERHVEVGQSDAAYLDQVAVHSTHVLDVGEVNLASEIDVFPKPAVCAEPGTPKQSSVEHGLIGRFADQDVVALIEPAVVEIQATTQMNAKSLVLGFRDEAIIPFGRKRFPMSNDNGKAQATESVASHPYAQESEVRAAAS